MGSNPQRGPTTKIKSRYWRQLLVFRKTTLELTRSTKNYEGNSVEEFASESQDESRA
jgi:hypothetical protein